MRRPRSCRAALVPLHDPPLPASFPPCRNSCTCTPARASPQGAGHVRRLCVPQAHVWPKHLPAVHHSQSHRVGFLRLFKACRAGVWRPPEAELDVWWAAALCASCCGSQSRVSRLLPPAMTCPAGPHGLWRIPSKTCPTAFTPSGATQKEASMPPQARLIAERACCTTHLTSWCGAQIRVVHQHLTPPRRSWFP
jgi:hypothetical protein